MKYAICNETFGDWPFEKAFAMAREIGYTGIEIAPFTLKPGESTIDVKEVSKKQRAEVCRQAAEAGLEVVGLHWLLAKTEGFYLTSPDKAVRQRTSDYFKSLAQLCGDLGGKVLVLGSPQQRNLLPGVSYAEAAEYAADVLRAAMPTFADCKVTLALEPLSPNEGDFLLTAESAIELANLVDSPHCRLHLDVKAMSSEEKSIPDILRENRESLEHFHANDPNLLGPGMGDVEYEPIFAALKEIDYQGWVSVEVFDYSPGPEEIGRQSLQYMKKIAAQVGVV